MKKHKLIHFILSLAMVLFLINSAEIFFRSTKLYEEMLRQDMFSSKLKYFNGLDFDPDVIAMGNSRVRHGIDTRIIDDILSEHLHRTTRSWNFGMGGVNAYSFLPLSLRILERKHKPLVVVIGIAPADFVNETPRALSHLVFSRPWQPSDLYDALLAGANSEQAMEIFLNSSYELLSFRPTLVDVLLRNRKLGPSIGPDFFGYKQEHVAPPGLQPIRATNRARGYRKELVGKDKSTGPFKLGCFRVALMRLVDAGLKVVVVAMPESSQVHHIASEPDSAVSAIFGSVRNTCEKMGVRFEDLSSPDWLDDNCFTDGDHMNLNGAHTFTTFLVNEIIIPELND